MLLRLLTPNLHPAIFNYSGNSKSVIHPHTGSLSANKPKRQRFDDSIIRSALPETAASIAVAATIVGAATTFLVRRTKESESTEVSPSKTCEDCGGSGVCSECRGEGFVLKRLSDENAEKARLMAKNMATRYTAGLPKKWSYCSKCSSARSCVTCGGSGKIIYKS